MTVLLLLFQFGFFSFFSYLTTVARTSNTLLNKSGKSRYLCLIPDLRGNAFSFSPLSMMLSLCLSYMAFIILRYGPSLYSFWRVFYHKPVLNFVKCFFCICWNDQRIFILQFVNVEYHTDWFEDTEKSVYLWHKSHLIMVYDSFNVLLDSVCWYFVENFASMFISNIGL